MRFDNSCRKKEPVMRKWIIYNVAFLLIVSSNVYSETMRSGPSNKKLEAGSSFGKDINISDFGNDTAPPPGTAV